MLLLTSTLLGELLRENGLRRPYRERPDPSAPMPATLSPYRLRLQIGRGSQLLIR